ncbi:MAG: hypothetical protein ACTSWA_03250 [Candidatus Thorarchaeota archaeon]
MKAYIQIPFQETPAVLGDVTKRIVDKIVDDVIPRNLPSNWYQDDSIRILSAFWVNETTLAISVTVRGKKDRSGRENFLSHVVVSDEASFILDPISSIMKLDELSDTPSIATGAGLDKVLEASKSILGNELELKAFLKRIALFDDDFIDEALYSLTNADHTFIGYSNLVRLMDYLRLTFLTMKPILGMKCSFITLFGTFDQPDSAYTIQCFKTDQKRISLEKEDKSALKEIKAGLIDLPREKVLEKEKKSKITRLLISELNEKPWVGLDRITHLNTLHTTLKQRISKEPQKMNPFAVDLLKTLERLDRIKKTSI